MSFDPLTADVLPDSRASIIATPKGARMGSMGWMVPCFCANCGVEGAAVPATSTFVFWLCVPCYETHGHLTPFMVVSDEVFWEHVKQEQLAEYGRLLTTPELIAIVEADVSPLATLIKQGHN